MRISLKRLSCYVITTGLLINLYIFSYFHIEEEEEDLDDQYSVDLNEFLVLDWTGSQHIFQEPDPIPCDFSHITPVYCQSRVHSVVNRTVRSKLLRRCSCLSKLTVRWSADRSRLQQANLLAYHSIHMPASNRPKLRAEQFSTVYILESEVHSSQGHYWHEIDFPIWYNLNRSYPEPITYFDLRLYLKQLFASIRVPFAKKIRTASIVWISSNCYAYNGRHLFIQQLMSYIRIDSFGNCLNNIQSDDVLTRRKLNSMIYSSYKFVLAIENSNCEDYITEKLIQAFASTSIPIIAGRNGKPDYARFAPKHSYINVYDYKSIKDLANYLEYLSNNETAYNEYLWFRQNSTEQSLNGYLRLADKTFGSNSTIRQWLLTKETSRNKYCKLAEFIYTNDWDSIHRRKKFDRPTAEQVCLPRDDLRTYFSFSSTVMRRHCDILFISIVFLSFRQILMQA